MRDTAAEASFFCSDLVYLFLRKGEGCGMGAEFHFTL